jgi:TRC40/GET3/ArsA family transport-energizing ATPase
MAPRIPANPVDALLEAVSSLNAPAVTKRPATNLAETERGSAPALSRVNRRNAPESMSGGFPDDIRSNLARPLTIVAGKGGVGKTTTACALAIATADGGKNTLLVSTDPAPSISDALDQIVGDTETAVAGSTNLVARQMDATRAFAAMRDQYQGRIDEVFAGITGRGMDLAHDREILRDLLALAPPGIDELYALTILGDTIDEGRFGCIVVDPAPTGHLLRLLDMPAMAIAWAHQLMRLMLKYKEIVSLGEAAQDLLAFAKRTRSLEARLHDPHQATAILVALDEPLVRGETERLLAALRDRDIATGAIVWNRVAGSVEPLPTRGPVPQLFAPVWTPPPVGVEPLRTWWAAVKQ